MKPGELAPALRALAERLMRLQPLNHDPERYFVERDELRADLEKLAARLTPREPHCNPKAKFVDGDAYVAGRRVIVSRRRAAVGSRQ